MKKGRKPKSKNNTLTLEKEKHRNANLSGYNKYRDELLEEHLSMRISDESHRHANCMMVDSENLSQDDKSDFRINIKKQSEKYSARSLEGSEVGSNVGPLTRRKELQLQQSNWKNIFERNTSDLNNLKKFDEFFKDKKNVEHEMYLYKPPRISKEFYQVTIENNSNNTSIDTNSNICYNNQKLINYEKFNVEKLNEKKISEFGEKIKFLPKNGDKNSKDENIPTLSLNEKYFDYTKISKDDLNYYLKFVNYYKESSSISISGNIFLKGVHNFEQNALKLLRESKYDINLALKKILFPVLDLINNEENKINEINFKNGVYCSWEEPYPKENVFATKKIGDTTFFSNLNPPSVPADPMIYVNSALNDLIGSNIQEKEEWLKYVKERIESKITLEELYILIELANKMKIDIPEYVTSEIESSLNYSRIIRRYINEKNSLPDIVDLQEKTNNFKVRTDEFSQLEEIIKKAKNWICKVEDLESKTMNYKTLQTLFGEAKGLPVKFNKFDLIKNRYLKAQKWQDKYSHLPKHSKTRQQGNNNVKKTNKINNSTERCTVAYLLQLIKECDEINFTSNDVISLKNNFDKLREAEARIAMTMEDSKILKTKELLNDFVNTLDSLKFTTELYDLVLNKLEYINWEDRKNYYMGNKVLKMKHLRSLIKEANQKNLSNLEEINTFTKFYNKIEAWMYTMSNIFYSNDIPFDSDKEEEEDKKVVRVEKMNFEKNSLISKNKVNKYENSLISKNENENDINNSSRSKNYINDSQINKKKIEFEELLKLYEEGKDFNIKPEEVEHLLMKCEEVFEFINECKNIHGINNKKIEDKIDENINFDQEATFNINNLKSKVSFDLQKLSNIRKQILKYNIKCLEFDFIDNQITQVQNWMEANEDFIIKYNSQIKLNFKNITCLENRQETIEMLENYLRTNSIFYDNLFELIYKVPIFAKSSKEFLQLIEIKEKAENHMNITFIQNNKNNNIENYSEVNLNFKFFPEKMELEDLEHFLNATHLFSVKKDFFEKLLCFYRAKSWAHVAFLKEKMSYYEAESMIKEAASINFQSQEIDEMKKNILKTKDWVKQSKKVIFAHEKIGYETVKKFINDGAELPLDTPELRDLVNFQALLEDEIFQARNFLLIEHNYSELLEFCEKIDGYPINDVPEFEFLFSLKKLCMEWKTIAEKILASRKLSNLFFKIKNNDDCNNSNTFKDNYLNSNLKQIPILLADENFNEDDDYEISQSFTATNLNYTSNKKVNNKNSSLISSEDYNNFNNFNNFNNNIQSGKKQKLENENSQTIIPNFNTSQNDLLLISNNLTSTNINVINNNFYFSPNIPNINNLNINEHINDSNELGQIKSKKNSKKFRKKEYDNLINIVNTIPHKNLNSHATTAKRKMNTHPLEAYLLTQDVKINSKKFENYSYEDKIKYLSKTVILKEEKDENYCICRRGDDSLHYMLMCENCKEWFHGKCVKISKHNADKIPQYFCVACSRRKDVFTNNYQNDFHNLKRISYFKFTNLLKQAEEIPIKMKEMEALKNIESKISTWLKNYENMLKKLIVIIGELEENFAAAYFCNSNSSISLNNNSKLNFNQFNNLKILDDKTEKIILDLYHESEGFPVELEQSTNLILILKHNDWFRDAFKCIENKKYSEKINKKLLAISYSIFNKDYIVINSESEDCYFKIMNNKGLNFLTIISQNYEKYSSILNIFKNQVDKKNQTTCEELISQLENIVGKNPQLIIEEIHNYLNWVNDVKMALSSNNLFEIHFQQLVEKAKHFNFKTSLLEKFKRIYLNPLKQSVSYYKSLLFPDNEKKKKNDFVLYVDKIKKEKNVDKKKINDTKEELNIKENSLNCEEENLNKNSNTYEIEKNEDVIELEEES